MKADEIKSLRQKLGFTQIELAGTLGCQIATVSRWENGHARPMPGYIKLLEMLQYEAQHGLENKVQKAENDAQIESLADCGNP